MPMEMFVTWAVVAFAALTHGLTGLGFGLICVPVLVLFGDPRVVVSTVLILMILLNALILLQAWRHVDLRQAGPLTLGSVLGVPFGSYLLIVLSPDSLKLLVAGLALLFSIPLLLDYSRPVNSRSAAFLLVGIMSGVLQSSTSMGSPPSVLFMANQGMPKEAFRGTQVLRSLATSALSVVALITAGVVDPSMALRALMLVPALLLGLAAGSWLLKRVPQILFRKLAVLTVATTALISLAGYFL